MERNNRWLGWVAIGLGLLALVVALGGRMHSTGPRGWGQDERGGQFSGRSWNGPGADTAPGFLGDRGADDGRGFAHGPFDRGFGPHGHGGRVHGPPFFLFPLFILGGLARLAGLVGLVLLVVHLLRRRRNGNNQPPTAEDKSYTGETTSL